MIHESPAQNLKELMFEWLVLTPRRNSHRNQANIAVSGREVLSTESVLQIYVNSDIFCGWNICFLSHRK